MGIRVGDTLSPSVCDQQSAKPRDPRISSGRAAEVDANVCDQSLMRLIKQGNSEAFATLFEKYESTALLTARRSLQNLGVAEEVVQEVFLSVWRAPSNYRADAGTVRVWMMSLVRHRAIDAGRHEQALANRSRRVSMDRSNQQQPPTPGDQVPEQFNRAEQRLRLEQALSSLSPKQRGVVDLMYFGGLTQHRVAESLNLPLGTVKSRSHLAIRNLRSVVCETNS